MDSLNSSQQQIEKFERQKLCINLLTLQEYIEFCYTAILINPDWISENSFGRVEDCTLIKLIHKSYKSKKLQVLLVSIVDSLDGENISNSVFELLYDYPVNGVKKELWTALCHKSLAENQLLKLCELDFTWECYYELAILYFVNARYTQQDIIDFIIKFSKSSFFYMHDDLVKELIYGYIPSSIDKKDYLLRPI
ncbi:MAG: hypothetical protein ACYCYM_06885 [Saccharofermentanales bacterium]